MDSTPYNRNRQHFPITLYTLYFSGPKKYKKKTLLECENDIACQQKCVYNFLSSQSKKCFRKKIGKIACEDLGRMYEAGPGVCPGDLHDPFGMSVKKCCKGYGE